MAYKLRPYQEEAVQANVDFFTGNEKGNALQIISTGAGKSILIAETVKRLGEPTLILQPSKEILAQNISKYRAYGNEASIYSASLSEKIVSDVTYATIGSIVKKPELFKHFPYLILDECHFTNAKSGMYKDFIDSIGETKILGLTATPYRLSTSPYGSILKFLTRTRPRVFTDVNYCVQNKMLFDQGFLCPLEYYDMKPYLEFDRKKILSNSTGAEFDDDSMKAYMDSIHFMPFLVKSLTRLLEVRKAIVVFVRFTAQAFELADHFGPEVAVVTGNTPGKERDRLITDWKSGKIKCLVNVGVLSVGVDYPELDTVVLARPTKSLALFYQQSGRGIRVHPDKKSCFLVDLCGNIQTFGKIEDLHVGKDQRGLWQVSTNGRPLTNCILN